MTEATGEWLECKADKEYEIWSEFPYPIRRKGSDKVIAESTHGDGYVRCQLNKKDYDKHRIIALQFIPNPNNLPQVDHINRIKTDYRLSNLRWVSHSTNGKNKSGHKGYHYTYLDELPDTAEPLDFYGNHELDGVFVD